MYTASDYIHPYKDAGDIPRMGDPEVRACDLSPPTGLQIPLIFTERRISGAQVGSPSRRTGRSPPGLGRSGAYRSRCILPLRTGVSTPGKARDPDLWEAYPRPFPRLLWRRPARSVWGWQA